MYEKFPQGAAKRTDPVSAAEDVYDAVIVGGGICGALIALRLSEAGRRVLILEAGPAEDLTLRGYEDYLNRFYSAISKDNQAPYPAVPNAPMPRGTDVRRITPGAPDASSYIVQSGPFATDTTYTRVLGGTTMHWEGKALRMLPEDFRMRTLYGQGRTGRSPTRTSPRTTTRPNARSASRPTWRTRPISGSPSTRAMCSP